MPRLPKTERHPPTPVLLWSQCFAKSTERNEAGISVYDHCLIAGEIAQEILRSHTSGYRFPEGFPFLVAAHDAGKVSPGFLKHCSNQALQTLCPALALANMEASGWERNHAEIGEAAFIAWAKKRGQRSAWMRWAEPIGRHHGTRSRPKTEGCGPYGGPEWATERNALLDELHKRFLEKTPETEPTQEQLNMLGGLMCVSDWIASNEEFFPNTGIPVGTPIRERVKKALSECGWNVPRFRPGLSFEDVFPFSPNEMQKAFIQSVDRRGVYVLEAPMGTGKTEAALFAAYRLMTSGQNKGLFFGLPTRLTSDRIHQRVEAFMENILENPSMIKLIHGHAWMNLESRVKEFQAGMSWFHPRKRALLAPFGVGTIDQALMSVLKVKHHFVRTFGLAGKVVILDEVHSYDAYTGTLLNCLVEELRKVGCSVIILSATLTAQRRADFTGSQTAENAYPLISAPERTLAPPPPPERDIRLEYCGDALDVLIERAVSAAENGLCVLWIANTVAQSQKIFLHIKSECRENTFQVGLLHSRFPSFRRMELEDQWIERLGKTGDRPKGCVLVATQVVEQSVDIDADLLVTELAPTDMLLQRIGRLCRHTRKTRPDGSGQTWIYGPPDSNWSDAEAFENALGLSRFVYAPYVLWKTLHVWRERSRVLLPNNIRELLESTYDEAEIGPSWISTLKAKLDAERKTLHDRALGLTALYCGDDDEDKAPTRHSSRPTLQVLILQSCDDCDTVAELVLCDGTSMELKSGERDFQKAVALHQNIVSLPMHSALKQTTPAWLSKQVFGPVAVLTIDGEKLFNLIGLEMPWGYHRDKGVYKRETGNHKPEHANWENDDEFNY